MKRRLAAAALVAGLWVSAAWGQEPRRLTLDPAMVKGPAGAPVTIVEFSDYQ